MNMQHFKFVKSLFVEHARYVLQDDKGNNAVLFVDYKNNTFQTEVSSDLLADNFAEEVKRFAKGLLARKHSVNLALKEQYL